MSLPELVPIDVLFGNPERASPTISPDGTRLAYLAPVDGVLNVWVGAVGSNDFKPVTDDHLRGIRAYFWAHDGRHILYLQDSGGDENWRIYTVDLSTGDVVDRTPFAGAQAVVVGLSKRVPGQVLVGLNADDPRYHDVYRLDLAAGTFEKEVSNPGFDGWLVDNELVVRGAIRPREDGGVDYLMRDGDEWSLALAVDPDDYVINVTHQLGFTGDDKRLWLPSVQGSDKARLTAFDPAKGTTEVIASDDDYDLPLGGVMFHPDTREPQLISWQKDRVEYQVLDASIEGDVAKIRAALPGEFRMMNRDHADRTWLLLSTVDDGSASYWSYDRSSGDVRLLFKNQPELDRYRLAKMEPFSFTSRDGLRVHGYLTTPPGVERANLPAVLHVHGGPWGGRHTWGYSAIAQWIANRGYLCIEVDYRGSGGYGKAFLNASAREWAGRMHDDLIDAVEWTIAQGFVDRDRVAIFGGSYGGYAALVGATFTPNFFRCAVDYVGPSNLITLLESIPPYWFGVATQFHKLLGHPERDRDFLWSISPLSRVDQIVIPILIAQGANDPRVKQAESEQIVQAMRERGVEHEYLLFPDEGHGFARPENTKTFFRASERFLAKHLGGRSE
jgi:dipeptidyl aminopeptidase/acylaminoacyl peptidase